MRKQRFAAFQVACTYVGTVVGAGFASGQEIYHFFGRFGAWGYLGIALALFLFSYLGYQMMLLGHRVKARSFREVSNFLFGPWIGGFINAVLLLMLFGVTVAMLAGSGELFRERMNLPFDVGVSITIAVTFLTLFRGIDGILKANSVIVPIMVSFVLFAAVRAFMTPHSLYHAYHISLYLAGKPLLAGISAVVYGSFNVGLAAGVLIPVGADIGDKTVLQMGSRWGASALAFMLMAVTFTLFIHYPQATAYAVPMGYVATTLGRFLQWMFVLVLWGEIYSTLVGNVYAMVAQIPMSSRMLQALVALILLGIAFLFSQIGFAAIVAYGYTVFGYVSLLLLLTILWPRSKQA
ncbi:hypothetical protein [Alicyclobacillus sp. SO9]|uniref:YkvI family membrane protein n=1 Tax=Alicyclobacillus sp. SO9 TaxID=2665646 RepID=UPI0018E7A5BB|nr:hypothetical protein [Alicyclobacillus sp. SO9]QQE76788.1 hypothetical protein GI364_12230 [Alicyclobacillus sp. SO9]